MRSYFMSSYLRPARHTVVALLCATSAGLAAATVMSVASNVPAFSKPADDDVQIAKSLATMLRAGRTVISKHQDRINDPSIGNKGLDGKAVLTEAVGIYREATGVDPY